VRATSNPLVLLGGPNHLNWRSHLFFLVPALSTAGFFDYERLGGEPALWFNLALIGFITTVAMIEVFKPLLVRLPKTWTRALLATVILLLAGLVRGYVIFDLGRSFGIVPPEDIVYRLFGGPVFVLSVYVISNAIVELYLGYKSQASQLEKDQRRLERARASYTFDLKQVNDQQRARVRELLAPPVWELTKKMEAAKDKNTLREALLSLQSINNDVVRPLSHDLQASANTGVIATIAEPGQPATKFPSRIRVGKAMPLWLFSSVLLTVGVLAQINTLSISQGLQVSLLTALPAIAGFLIIRGLLSKANLDIWVAGLLLVVLFFGLGAGIAYFVTFFEIAPSGNYWLQVGSYLAISGTATFGFGLFEAGWKSSLKGLEKVTNELAVLNSRLRQQLWLGQKSLAMELHGSVQGTLHALAARMAKMDRPNAKQLQEILDAIRKSLERIENEDYLAGGSIESLLDELQLLWEGTLEISWTITETAKNELDRDLGLARCLFEVVREATTNSVKHGGSTRLSIDISIRESLLELQILNDGNLVESPDSYTGKELMDQLCFRHSLANTQGGVLLHAQMSLSPQAETESPRG